MYKSLFSIVILASLVLSGCAGRQAPGIPPEIDSVRISGKLSIRLEGQGHTANFRWLQTGEDYLIEVWGPLGQGRTTLQGDPASMQVLRGGEVLAEGPVEAVMMANLGWTIPVEVLPAWLQGAGAENPPATILETDEDGRTLLLEQVGWRVEFDRFSENRPRRIVATNGERKVVAAVREITQ